MARKHAAPSPKRVMAAQALARELGWVCLNEQELRLIKQLRFTTYHGRNLVIEIAGAMCRAHPWIDARQAVKTNTATTYPANDRRFYSHREEK